MTRSISSALGGAYAPTAYAASSRACASTNGNSVGVACAKPMNTVSRRSGRNIRLNSRIWLPGAEMTSGSKNGKVML